jgi:hypothetical protein
MPGTDGMPSETFFSMGFVTPREKGATLFIGLSPFKDIRGTVSRTENKMSTSQCGKTYKMHKIEPRLNASRKTLLLGGGKAMHMLIN